MQIVIKIITHTFLLMALLYALIEIICYLAICFVEATHLKGSQDKITSTVLRNSIEISNSFSDFYERKISSFSQDLLLLSNHIFLLVGIISASNHKSTSSLLNNNECLITSKDYLSNYNEYNGINLINKLSIEFDFDHTSNDNILDYLLNNDNNENSRKLYEIFDKVLMYKVGQIKGDDLKSALEESNETEIQKSDNFKDFRNLVCGLISFLKIKTFAHVLKTETYPEIVNYTMYIEDVILAYPISYIDHSIMENLPYFIQTNKERNCFDEYDKSCFDFTENYLSDSESETEHIIYLKPIYKDKSSYMNICIKLANISFLKNITKSDSYFCLMANISQITHEIFLKDNDLTLNLVYYDEGRENINLVYSSKPEVIESYKIFNKSVFGDYNLSNSNSQLSLFHSLYYEIINNFELSDKQIENLINEYEENTKKLKEVLANNTEEAFTSSFNTSIIVNQTIIKWGYDNEGNKSIGSSKIIKNEFIFYINRIMTNQFMYHSSPYYFNLSNKHLIAYSITSMKTINPYKTTFLFNIFCYKLATLQIFFLIIIIFFCICYQNFLQIILKFLLYPIKIFKREIKEIIDKEAINQLQDNSSSNIDPVQNNRNSITNLITSTKNIRSYMDSFIPRQKKESMNNTNLYAFNNLSMNQSMSNRKNSAKNNSQKNEIQNLNKISSNDNTDYFENSQYTGIEIKSLENINILLKKILHFNSKNIQSDKKAEFFKQIAKEIPKNLESDLYSCHIIIATNYLKQGDIYKAKNELEKLLKKLEHKCLDFKIQKEINVQTLTSISSVNKTYINDHKKLDVVDDNTMWINLQMILQNCYFILGYTNYKLFLRYHKELKNNKNGINNVNTNINPGNTLMNFAPNNYLNNYNIFNSAYGNNTSFVNSNANNNNLFAFGRNKRVNKVEVKEKINRLTEKKIYFYENAVAYYKKAYKINDKLQINLIKNIFILIIIAKMHLKEGKKNEEVNKILKKTMLLLHKFNILIKKLTMNGRQDEEKIDNNIRNSNININANNLNNNFNNLNDSGNNLNTVNCIVDPNIMLIVNGLFFQIINYNISKFCFKETKYTNSLLSLKYMFHYSFFTSENIFYKGVKQLKKIKNKILEDKLNDYDYKKAREEKQKEKNILRRNTITSSGPVISSSSNDLFIKRKTIEYLYKKLEELKSTKISEEEKLNIDSALEKLNEIIKNNLGLEGKISNNDYSKKIFDFNYEFEPYLYLLILLYSPLTLDKKNKISLRIDKIYNRYDPVISNNQVKALIIIISDSFIYKFNSVRSFSILLINCISKYFNNFDLIGYFYFSNNKAYDCIPLAEKNFNFNKIIDKLNCLYKKKPESEGCKISIAFDIAIKMFLELYVNEDKSDKIDKYIFTFAQFRDIKYDDPLDTMFQINNFNNVYLSLYFFGFNYESYWIKGKNNNKNAAEGKDGKDKECISEKTIEHYRKFIRKFVEGHLIIVNSFNMIKIAFANITNKQVQKNLLNNDLNKTNYII